MCSCHTSLVHHCWLLALSFTRLIKFTSSVRFIQSLQLMIIIAQVQNNLIISVKRSAPFNQHTQLSQNPITKSVLMFRFHKWLGKTKVCQLKCYAYAILRRIYHRKKTTIYLNLSGLESKCDQVVSHFFQLFKHTILTKIYHYYCT